MAEYRTLTGNFSLRGVVQDVMGDDYKFQSETMKVGTDSNYNDHRVYATLSGGDASNEDISSSAIQRATLTVSVKKESTTTVSSRLYIYFYNKSVDTYSAHVLFNALNGGQSSNTTATIGENTTNSQTVSVDLGASNATNIKNYGVGFTVDGNDIVRLESVSIEYQIVDEKVPPTLGLRFPNGRMVNGTYYHDPHKPFLLQGSYSQAANAPMEKMKFMVYTEYPNTSMTYTFAEITDVTETVTWYPDHTSFAGQRWDSLPRQGAVGILAVTNGGYYSDELIVPFVIAESVIKVTSPMSGGIVKNDGDLRITFSIEAPPELPTMEPPDYIYCYPGYDGAIGNTGTMVYGNTYTIPVKKLAGHNSVNIYVSTMYSGAANKSGYTDSTVGHLFDETIIATWYIQEVATSGHVSLSSTTHPMVTVRWESSGQAAFQVMVDNWLSDIVWGSDTSYKIPFVLGFGENHAVSVRIQDKNGNWGEWSIPVYTSATTLLGDTSNQIQIIKKDWYIGIQWAAGSLFGNGLTEDVLLYRNDELIAVSDIAEMVEFTDATATGETTYQIVVPYIQDPLDKGCCWYTKKVTVDATPATDGITVDGEWLPLRYTIDAPQRTQTTRTEETYTRYYSGRNFPISMRSGRSSKKLSLRYGDPDTSLADKLESLAGRVVLYRNKLGEKMWGELNDITANRGKRYCDVQFDLTQTDKNEMILYDWVKKYTPISTLKIGDKVLFGKYQVATEKPEQIAWIIVDSDSSTETVVLMAEGILDRLCYDAKEPNSDEYYFQTNGNATYKLSNIHQWLNSNSPAGKWYTPAHATDQSPDSDSVVARYGIYADRPGFLYNFRNEELACIESTTVQSNRPMYDPGEQVIDEYETKVYLPSITEIGCTQEDEPSLGSVFSYFGISSNSPVAYPTKQASENSKYSSKMTWNTTKATAYFTRNATTGKYVSYVVGGPTTKDESGGWESISYSPAESYGIRPVLRVKRSMMMSMEKNSDGYYVAKVSE